MQYTKLGGGVTKEIEWIVTKAKGFASKLCLGRLTQQQKAAGKSAHTHTGATRQETSESNG